MTYLMVVADSLTVGIVKMSLHSVDLLFAFDRRPLPFFYINFSATDDTVRHGISGEESERGEEI